MTPKELKTHRKAVGMTQDQFASFLGFNSGRYVRAMELGERRITERTERLVNFLKTGKTKP